MIQVSNLTRKFAGVTAVDDISFNVARGRITAILGPNGAGKTTTLRVLSGYLAPTSGRVMIDGLESGEHSLEIRRRIGYLPENVPLYPEMRVREYLTFRARLKGVPRNRLASRLEAVRNSCGLESVFDTVIGRLSRGYRQRIGLADSLIHKPQLLILDEPTIGLDPNQIRAMRELIRGLAGKHTIILATHFLHEAELLCQRALIMHQGRIIADNAPESLASMLSCQSSLTVEINVPPEVAAPELKKLAGVTGLATLPAADSVAGADSTEWYAYRLDCAGQDDLRAAVFHTVTQQRWVLRELHSERKSLEDAFALLTENAPDSN